MKPIVVSVITAMLVLILGVLWMFGLLLIMNGFPQSKANQVLIGYFILLGICVILAGIVSNWGVKKLLMVTTWKIWIVTPITILGILIIAGVILFFGGIFVMVIVGS